MGSPERVRALRDAVRYVVARGLEGDIVECGVWKGGSMLAVARTLTELGQSDRGLWLYDTYEGMSEPTDADLMPTGEKAADLLAAHDRSARLWAVGPLEGVREVMLSSGYPEERMHFVKGKVEETIPAQAPEKIALLRLDTDWYESTRHELDHLWPRLVPGGVLILDDYGHWQGARKAVDEYIAEHGLTLLLNRIDYTARLAIKT
jgi:hypothetical protein